MSWYDDRPVAATANTAYTAISTRPQPERLGVDSGTAAPQGVEAQQEEGDEQAGHDDHARARAAGFTTSPPRRDRRRGDQADEVEHEDGLVHVGPGVRQPGDAVDQLDQGPDEENPDEPDEEAVRRPVADDVH